MCAAEHECEKDREREKEIERVLEMGVSISEMEQAIFDLMSHRLMDSFIAYIGGVWVGAARAVEIGLDYRSMLIIVYSFFRLRGRNEK